MTFIELFITFFPDILMLLNDSLIPELLKLSNFSELFPYFIDFSEFKNISHF